MKQDLQHIWQMPWVQLLQIHPCGKFRPGCARLQYNRYIVYTQHIPRPKISQNILRSFPSYVISLIDNEKASLHMIRSSRRGKRSLHQVCPISSMVQCTHSTDQTHPPGRISAGLSQRSNNTLLRTRSRDRRRCGAVPTFSFLGAQLNHVRSSAASAETVFALLCGFGRSGLGGSGLWDFQFGPKTRRDAL